jgi:phosphatidylinositol-bisphosphatase
LELDNALAGYSMVVLQQLVGLCLFVYVKQTVLPTVKAVAKETVLRGMGGAAGNKGATIVR